MKLQLDPERYEACSQYNDWLDEQYIDQYGELTIVGFTPRPSFVLFSLSQETYLAAFADFQAEWQDELKRVVFEDFPTPIAYYFYRFEHGYDNEHQRLLFLRDTWESLVDVLHTTAVAECRFRRISLADPIHFSHLTTDSVAQRLLNIERVINSARRHDMALSIEKIISLSTLQKMRELNQTRNAFSHSAAHSELQARGWIGESYDDVLDLLDDLRALADTEILRYLGQLDGATLRCETFNGHGSTRTIRNVKLSVEQVRDSQRYFQQGQIILAIDGYLYGLQPLMHYREDMSGHMTKLCVFRKTYGDSPNRRLEYEIVGESSRWDEDRTAFKSELDELRQLFGLGPD